MKTQQGARPIQSQDIRDHYRQFEFKPVPLDTYIDIWRRWLTESGSKTLQGLDQFDHGDFVAGTSQAFDHFWLRHQNRQPSAFRGEFKYHACVNRSKQFCWLDSADDLRADHGLVISLPFSDYGGMHPDWNAILDRCDNLGVPVCVDLAYWGIAQNVCLDLAAYACIEEVTCSLSKPFWVLENHRVGVRFTRSYKNDGISMINEVGMQNVYSMSLGFYFMQTFDCDWISRRFRSCQQSVCAELGLEVSDSVIFGLGGIDFQQFNRGIRDNNRVCISEFLNDIPKEN